jgi:hypothetical protein
MGSFADYLLNDEPVIVSVRKQLHVMSDEI